MQYEKTLQNYFEIKAVSVYNVYLQFKKDEY